MHSYLSPLNGVYVSTGEILATLLDTKSGKGGNQKLPQDESEMLMLCVFFFFFGALNVRQHLY